MEQVAMAAPKPLMERPQARRKGGTGIAHSPRCNRSLQRTASEYPTVAGNRAL
jgi:hypothetical protein